MAPSRVLRRPKETRLTLKPQFDLSSRVSKLKPPTVVSKIPRASQVVRKTRIPIKKRPVLTCKEYTKQPTKASTKDRPKQTEEEFILDPNALASILNNEGILTNTFGKNQVGCTLLDANGRPSLCRRIPRGSSVYVDPSRPSLSQPPGRIPKGVPLKHPAVAMRRTTGNSQSESLYSSVKSRYAVYRPEPAVVAKPEFLPPRPSTAKRGVKFRCTNETVSSPMLRIPKQLPPKSPAMRILRNKSKESDEDDLNAYKDHVAVALFLNDDDEDEEEKLEKPAKDIKSVKLKQNTALPHKSKSIAKKQMQCEVSKCGGRNNAVTSKDQVFDKEIVSPKVINECKPTKHDNKQAAIVSCKFQKHQTKTKHLRSENEKNPVKVLDKIFSRKVDTDVVLDLLQKHLKSVRRRTVFAEVEAIINNVQSALVCDPDKRDDVKVKDCAIVPDIKRSPNKRPSPEAVEKEMTPPKIWKDVLNDECKNTTDKTTSQYLPASACLSSKNKPVVRSDDDNHNKKATASTKANIAAFQQSLKEIERVQKESSLIEEKIKDLKITKETLKKQSPTALKVISNNSNEDDSFNVKLKSYNKLMQRLRSYKPISVASDTTSNKNTFHINTSTSDKENVRKSNAMSKTHHHVQTNLLVSKSLSQSSLVTDTNTKASTVATTLLTTASVNVRNKPSVLKSPSGIASVKWIQSGDEVSSGRLNFQPKKKVDLPLDDDDTCVYYSSNPGTKKSKIKELLTKHQREDIIKRFFPSNDHAKTIQSQCYDENNALFTETMISIKNSATLPANGPKCNAKPLLCNNANAKSAFSENNEKLAVKQVKNSHKSSNSKDKTSLCDEKTDVISNDNSLSSSLPYLEDDDLTAVVVASHFNMIKGQVVAPKAKVPVPPGTPQLIRRLRPELNLTPKKLYSPQTAASKSPFVKPSPSKVMKYRKKSYFSPSGKKSTRRFTEALLDEEVALITCRRFHPKPERDYKNPVSMFLQQGDDKHFIPLSPEIRQKNKENRFESAFSMYAT